MGGDFPGGSVVRTPYFHCKGAQVQFLIRELKILHAGQCGKKKTNKQETRKQAPQNG